MNKTQFVKMIMNYESDTFSGSGFKVKREEARKIADMCISHFVDNHLDGTLLDVFLAEIRGL